MNLAYIDPGSGSIMLQVILAFCVGGLAVFWAKIKSLFVRKKPADQTSTSVSSDSRPKQ